MLRATPEEVMLSASIQPIPVWRPCRLHLTQQGGAKGMLALHPQMASPWPQSYRVTFFSAETLRDPGTGFQEGAAFLPARTLFSILLAHPGILRITFSAASVCQKMLISVPRKNIFLHQTRAHGLKKVTAGLFRAFGLPRGRPKEVVLNLI